MEVLREYPECHHYIDAFEKTEFYCMNCGEKNVWAALSGDYYQGEEHLCLACEHSWNMPGQPAKEDTPTKRLIIEQLRTGEPAVATTPRGN